MGTQRKEVGKYLDNKVGASFMYNHFFTSLSSVSSISHFLSKSTLSYKELYFKFKLLGFKMPFIFLAFFILLIIIAVS
jgi:hypothetical protein